MKYQVNNTVVIGSSEKLEKYVWAIHYRMFPHNYEKHKCIKIQVMDSLLDYAETIIKGFKWCGLVEVSRKRKPIKNLRDGYVLNEAWELILEKIPVLQMQSEDDE